MHALGLNQISKQEVLEAVKDKNRSHCFLNKSTQYYVMDYQSKIKKKNYFFNIKSVQDLYQQMSDEYLGDWKIMSRTLLEKIIKIELKEKYQQDRVKDSNRYIEIMEEILSKNTEVFELNEKNQIRDEYRLAKVILNYIIDQKYFLLNWAPYLVKLSHNTKKINEVVNYSHFTIYLNSIEYEKYLFLWEFLNQEYKVSISIVKNPSKSKRIYDGIKIKQSSDFLNYYSKINGDKKIALIIEDKARFLNLLKSLEYMSENSIWCSYTLNHDLKNNLFEKKFLKYKKKISPLSHREIKHLASDSDIKRDKKIYQINKEWMNGDIESQLILDQEKVHFEAHNFEEFIKNFIITTVKENDYPESILDILQKVSLDVPKWLSLKPAEWIDYLEQVIDASRKKSVAYNNEKIKILTLDDWFLVEEADEVHFLEFNFYSQNIEVKNIIESLFGIQPIAHGLEDKKMKWEHYFNSLESRNVSFMQSRYDFQGQASKKLSVDKIFKFEYKEKSEQLDKKNPEREKIVENFNSSETSKQISEISSSKLQAYIKCPFRMVIEKYRMKNIGQEIEKNPSRLTLGSLYHEIAYDLLKSKDLSEESLAMVLDEKLKLAQGHFLIPYEAFKPYLMAEFKRFIDHENKIKSEIPEVQSYKLEYKFEFTLDESLPKIKGIIDRVDLLSNKLYVFDYKLSETTSVPFQNWLEEGHFQLFFYAEAVKKLFSSYELGGAYFLPFRTNERKRGLTLDAGMLSEFLPKKKDSTEAYELFREKMIELAGNLTTKMNAGDWSPKPLKKQDCASCSYKQWCQVSWIYSEKN